VAGISRNLEIRVESAFEDVDTERAMSIEPRIQRARLWAAGCFEHDGPGHPEMCRLLKTHTPGQKGDDSFHE
jgi:hypothetical protein